MKKNFRGSGILLIEVNSNKKLNLILFQSLYKGTYEELGGQLEGTDLWKNAVREAYEESAGYLDFSKIEEPKLYYDVKATNNNYYKCYIICIKKYVIKNNHFKKNLEILHKNKYKNTFLEMTNIKRYNIRKNLDISFRTKSTINNYIMKNKIKILNCSKNPRNKYIKNINSKLFNTYNIIFN